MTKEDVVMVMEGAKEDMTIKGSGIGWRERERGKERDGKVRGGEGKL